MWITSDHKIVVPARLASLVLVLICTIASAASPSPSPIDIAQAKAAFAEAEAVSNKEGGRLWGKKLYGRLFFVDPETRAVVANEPDSDGVLHAKDGVYVGTLPKEIIVSNAPVEWEGKRWTMLMWPTIPADTIDRQITFAHELFHRIQPGLGLLAPDSPNLQLDTLEGRLWLQLEWRALAAALVEQGSAQTQAIRDALAGMAHEAFGTIRSQRAPCLDATASRGCAGRYARFSLRRGGDSDGRSGARPEGGGLKGALPSTSRRGSNAEPTGWATICL